MPWYCPTGLVKLIERCWHPKKSFRPQFIEVVQMFKELQARMKRRLDDELPYNLQQDQVRSRLLQEPSGAFRKDRQRSDPAVGRSFLEKSLPRPSY